VRSAEMSSLPGDRPDPGRAMGGHRRAYDERRCAAVTGIGVVTPAGSDLSTFWTTLLEGKSVARRLEHLAGMTVDFACDVQGFDPGSRLGAKVTRRTDRFTQFALCAAHDALLDAGSPDVDPTRAAVVIGNGAGGVESWATEGRKQLESGAQINPLLVPMAMGNAAAAMVAIDLGWTGPSYVVNTACASGGYAVGEGLRMIRDGAADLVLAGGTEAGLIDFNVMAAARAHALSTRHDAPELASRPFDRDRDGFVAAEGAAVCLLEPIAQARARGARVHALLAGYGRNSDAFHLVMPRADGAQAARCMELALYDAGVDPADVTHVHAHGTSTQHNDLAEARAIHRVFGESAPPVTSSKGVMGHAVGAAGVVGVVASCLSAHHGLAPPVPNYETPDPEIALDVVAGEPRTIPRGAVISNAFGFGGHNASLVVVPA
jgi:3-oxoacyl-[acyl-carrier-protein] synthase II